MLVIVWVSVNSAKIFPFSVSYLISIYFFLIKFSREIILIKLFLLTIFYTFKLYFSRNSLTLSKFLPTGLMSLISQFITVSSLTPICSASSLIIRPLSILVFLIFSPKVWGFLGYLWLKSFKFRVISRVYMRGKKLSLCTSWMPLRLLHRP